MSSTLTAVELIVVVVPLTTKSPVTVNVVPTVTAPEVVKLVALATPKVGVTNVGLLAKTNAPEPVSSVTNLAKFALVAVAKKAAAPAAYPLTPVLIGKPVAFVNVNVVGVPNAPPLLIVGLVIVGAVNVLFVKV